MAGLGQGLELKQQQKLSPLQIQTIKLIELPVQELEQRIRAELEQNPVLDDTPDPESDEERTEISLDELQEDDAIAPYKLRVNNRGKDPMPEYNTFSIHESFTQSLRDQLGYCELTPHERDIALFIIGSLDDDGYLRRDLPTLVDDLAFRAGIDTDEHSELMIEQGKLIKADSIDELIEHHNARLLDCLLSTSINEGRLAIDIANRMTWVRKTPFENLNPIQQLFAAGEARAHLEHLVRQGKLWREMAEGCVYYTLS